MASPPSSPPPTNPCLQWILDKPDPLKEMLQHLDSKYDTGIQARTHCPDKDQQQLEGKKKLHTNYFAKNPVCSSKDFQHQFCITRTLFDRILSDIVDHNPYFQQKKVSIFFFSFFIPIY